MLRTPRSTAPPPPTPPSALTTRRRPLPPSTPSRRATCPTSWCSQWCLVKVWATWTPCSHSSSWRTVVLATTRCSCSWWCKVATWAPWTHSWWWASSSKSHFSSQTNKKQTYQPTWFHPVWYQLLSSKPVSMGDKNTFLMPVSSSPLSGWITAHQRHC